MAIRDRNDKNYFVTLGTIAGGVVLFFTLIILLCGCNPTIPDPPPTNGDSTVVVPVDTLAPDPLPPPPPPPPVIVTPPDTVPIPPANKYVETEFSRASKAKTKLGTGVR